MRQAHAASRVSDWLGDEPCTMIGTWAVDWNSGPMSHFFVFFYLASNPSPDCELFSISTRFNHGPHPAVSGFPQPDSGWLKTEAGGVGCLVGNACYGHDYHELACASKTIADVEMATSTLYGAMSNPNRHKNNGELNGVRVSGRKSSLSLAP